MGARPRPLSLLANIYLVLTMYQTRLFFMCINSYHLKTILRGSDIIIPMFPCSDIISMGKGTERLTSLSKVTQVVDGRGRTFGDGTNRTC